MFCLGRSVSDRLISIQKQAIQAVQLNEVTRIKAKQTKATIGVIGCRIPSTITVGCLILSTFITFKTKKKSSAISLVRAKFSKN
jgi:hypothetical protein